MAQPITDLQRAYDALTAKQALYTLLWNYYDGNAPLRYSNARLAEVFQSPDTRFTENWAAVVVDSELERIHLTEFDIAQDDATAEKNRDGEYQENPIQARLNDLFAETELNLDADDVAKATLVCGEAFVFVWRNDDDEDPANRQVEAYYNDPRLCHVFYESDNPRKKRFAAKWWVNEEDERRYLNLYYADRIEYYVSKDKSENVSTWKSFDRVSGDAADNPFGVIPIFHFKYERRAIKSAMANVIEPQDAINKLFADMMVAAEFGAFFQRWIITNADISALRNAPNEIWKVPAGDGEGEDTKVGQFDPTDLKNYLEAMDHLANDIAKITRTPKHYMFSQSGDPSGEALIAMEAPLNKKAQTTIDRLTPVWQQVAAFMLELDGTPGVKPSDITPVFDRPETVQPRTAAEIRQINKNAGIPLETTLRREGWTEEELKQLRDDQKAEAERVADGETSSLVNQFFGGVNNGKSTGTPAEANARPTEGANRAPG